MTYMPPRKTPEKISYCSCSPNNSLDSRKEKNRGKSVLVTYHDDKKEIVNGDKLVKFEDLARIKHIEYANSKLW